jgi:UDP-2,3-diacylglucosamine pyrophosphatase LpxH
VSKWAANLRAVHRLICRHVALNAAQYARENGFTTVTCGHIHLADDREVDGIRYLNTGSWLLHEPRYVVCSEKGISLEQFK